MANEETKDLMNNNEEVVETQATETTENIAATAATAAVEATETTETAETTEEAAKTEETPADNAAPVPTPPSQEEEKKEKSKSGILKVVGLVAAIAVVIAIVVVCLGGVGGINTRLYKLSAKAVGCYDELLFNRNADTAVVDLEIFTRAANKDLSAVVCYTQDSKKDDYTLWYVGSNLQPAKIDTVETLSRVIVSDDGKYVVYVSKQGSSIDDANLYIYDVSKAESIKIAKDIIPESVNASPNCKYVSYITNYDGYDDNDLYIAGLNSEPVKIAKNGCYAAAISDNGKSIIYVNEADEKLYYFNGKDSMKIASDISLNNLYINADETEILFSKDGKTYWYKAGNEAANKIYSKTVNYFVSQSLSWSDCINCRLVLDTFKNATFIDSEYKIITIDSKAEDVNKITSKYQDYCMSGSGKELVYAEGDELYYAKIGKGEEPVEIFESEEIMSVYSNISLSRIYIVNDDDELIYVTKDGKHELITNDIDDDYAPIICESTGKIYFIEDGDLYVADRTKKSKEKVKSDVEEMRHILGGVLYVTDDEKVGLIF